MHRLKVRSIFLTTLSVFPLISMEFLPTPLVYILTGLLLLRIKTHLPQYLIYPIAIGLIYYIKQSFGAVIVPETAISFLATMCLARFLAKDESDYRVNRILGFLWAGCFILFRTDLLSIISLTITSLLILKLFPYKDDERISLKQIFKIEKINTRDLLLGILLVIIMFVFFPRIYNFLPGVRNQPVGMIGYSKTINNSQSGRLNPSSQVAFYAQIRPLANELLYWRGRVHNYTDGYNWRGTNIVSRGSQHNYTANSPIIYQIKYEQDFEGDLILLDTPIKILQTNLRYYQKKETKTYRAYNKKKKAFLTAQSDTKYKANPLSPREIKQYLQLPGHTTNALNDILNYLKEAKTLNETLKLFEKYLVENKFTYTLNPKNTKTLKSFIETKQGFCTHYASLLGITLRKLGHPARLVSGFQGGLYNEVGGHYKVSSNDAHSWVEAYNGNNWVRVDPTSYIAPERVLRGGESFFTNAVDVTQVKNMNRFSAFYYTTKQYWENLNYRVSLFFDTYDREKQNTISENFKIKRYFFILIGSLIFISILACFYFMSQLPSKKLRPIDLAFDKFIKKLKKKSIQVRSTDSLSNIKEAIENKNLENENEYLQCLKLYEQVKYAHLNKIKELNENVQALK